MKSFAFLTIFVFILTLTLTSSIVFAQERKFGFGFVNPGFLIVKGYSSDQFFDAMFLTPPYPSSVQFIYDQG